MIRHNESVRLTMDPCTPRPSSGPYVPPSLERAIAARWKQWQPWVRMRQLRARDYDPLIATAESARLRQCHSEHIINLMRDSISMPTIRRHRLDDPRITDEVRAMLVEAAKERQPKAWFGGQKISVQRTGWRHSSGWAPSPETPQPLKLATNLPKCGLREQRWSLILRHWSMHPGNPSVRVRALLYAVDARPEAHDAQQSTFICPSTPARHVHREASHRGIARGNRLRVRRHAPHHGAARDQQDRSDAAH